MAGILSWMGVWLGCAWCPMQVTAGPAQILYNMRYLVNALDMFNRFMCAIFFLAFPKVAAVRTMHENNLHSILGANSAEVSITDSLFLHSGLSSHSSPMMNCTYLFQYRDI